MSFLAATGQNSANRDTQQAPVPERTVRGHACPTLRNPFRRSGRLTKTPLSQCLRRLESLHDIPIVQRTKWLQDAKATYPEHRLQILAGINVCHQGDVFQIGRHARAVALSFMSFRRACPINSQGGLSQFSVDPQWRSHALPRLDLSVLQLQKFLVCLFFLFANRSTSGW